jgi:hypothetical protein
MPCPKIGLDITLPSDEGTDQGLNGETIELSSSHEFETLYSRCRCR